MNTVMLSKQDLQRVISLLEYMKVNLSYDDQQLVDRLRKTVPVTYNHAFHLTFDMNSEKHDASDLTNDKIYAHVMGHIHKMYVNGTLFKNIDIFDTEQRDS